MNYHGDNENNDNYSNHLEIYDDKDDNGDDNSDNDNETMNAWITLHIYRKGFQILETILLHFLTFTGCVTFHEIYYERFFKMF